MSCSDVGKEGIVWEQQHARADEVGSVQQRGTGGQNGLRRKGRRDVVGSPRQGSGFAVAGAFAIVDDVVVGREGGCLASMAARGSAGCREIFKIIMVSVDTDWQNNTFDIHTPLLESFNHC